MTPNEVRAVLSELDRRLGAELAGFWHSIADQDPNEFRALLVEAYPDVVAPYAQGAAELAAEWYDLSPSTTSYRAVPAEIAPAERLTQSAAWALNVGTAETALDLLSGSASRAVMDAARDTVLLNSAREPGARWSRHASANACPFCRMLATRGADYLEESTADFRAHDSCHCMAVPQRPGHPVDEAPYVDEWRDQYKAARKESGSSDPKDILNAWARLI